MQANPQRPRLRWTALALLATSALSSGGCAKFFHGWHYNHITRTLHEETRFSYYHSPHTGRIIPKEHHSTCMVQFPCFGYESTCWHRWPEECPSCPVQGPEGVLLGVPYHGQIIEEVIEPAEGQPVQPPHGGPSADLPSSDDVPGDTLPSDVAPIDGVPDDRFPSDVPTSPLPDDASLFPSSSDPVDIMPSSDEIVSEPVEKFEDFEQFKENDEVNQRDESEVINPVDKPSSELADDESLKPAEPSLPVASDASAYVENSFVTKRPAVPVETPAPNPAAEKVAAPTAVEPAPPSDTQPAPSTPRVVQRSSRRVRSRVEPARSGDAAKNAPVKSPAAGNSGEGLSANSPTSETAAAVVKSTLPAKPVMAKRDSTTAPAIPAVHRNLSSRRLAAANSSLPSFKIVPVVPTPGSTVLSPMHVEAGQGAVIRFISDEKPDQIRVADETPTETTIRFR